MIDKLGRRNGALGPLRTEGDCVAPLEAPRIPAEAKVGLSQFSTDRRSEGLSATPLSQGVFSAYVQRAHQSGALWGEQSVGSARGADGFDRLHGLGGDVARKAYLVERAIRRGADPASPELAHGLGELHHAALEGARGASQIEHLAEEALAIARQDPAQLRLAPAGPTSSKLELPSGALEVPFSSDADVAKVRVHLESLRRLAADQSWRLSSAAQAVAKARNEPADVASLMDALDYARSSRRSLRANKPYAGAP